VHESVQHFNIDPVSVMARLDRSNRRPRIGTNESTRVTSKMGYIAGNSGTFCWPLRCSASRYSPCPETVTFAGSVLIAGGATITEAGLIAYIEQSNQSGPYPFMLLRDTFDGVPIIAGKYAHLAYTIQL
jgi:hypothetical protein